jgi:uncharacterized protein (TIGR01244 family)
LTEFRSVTGDFAVSPQIAPADVAAAAAEGFTTIINNRPDGEAADQPSSETIEAAALAAGLRYAHIPVVGRPTPGQIETMRLAMGGRGGGTLAFCRSGARSIATWALGARLDRSEILRLAAAAGYDLSTLL